MSVIAGIAEFLTARLDEREAWAKAASEQEDRGSVPTGAHWRFGRGENWNDWTPLPHLEEYVFDATLISVEEFETRSGVHRLPQALTGRIEDLSVAAAGHIVRHDPAYVLADIAAKRKVLGHLVQLADLAWTGSYAVRDEARAAIKAMALPFSGHPDYYQEWRP